MNQKDVKLYNTEEGYKPQIECKWGNQNQTKTKQNKKETEQQHPKMTEEPEPEHTDTRLNDEPPPHHAKQKTEYTSKDLTRGGGPKKNLSNEALIASGTL